MRTSRAKHSNRIKLRKPPTTAAAHTDINPFTESQSSRILLTRSTRWSDDHRLESQDKSASRRHQPNTPAGELGLGLQDNDITAAACDVPVLPDTESGLDDAAESVADNIDSNANSYDIYYDVHEYEDTDTGSLRCEPGGVLGGWHRVNHGLPECGRVLSLGPESQSSSLFDVYDVCS